MIQLTTVKQTLQLRGTTAPSLVVKTASANAIQITSSGPQGPQGVAGPQGAPGPIGNLDTADFPDFTLIFDNKLV